jgi:integrase/recombinase XerD
MNTNIVISLDTRRQKKDGSFPLVLRLGHNARTTTIPIGISMFEKDWDEESRAVKKCYSGVSSITRLNNNIQKKKAEAMDIIMKLAEKNQLDSLSVAELKDRIYRPEANQSFFNYANNLIEELKRANRFGTARSYKGMVSVLKDFCGGRDLSFSQLNYQFLCKFETNHLAKGNSYNGLSVYMRGIRAVYNKAIKAGIVEREHYPFSSYKIKSEPTDKRALEWDKFKKIIELEIEPGHICFNARNYFISSFMMYGINFSDMAYLRKENIVNGRIKYRRRKTSKLYDIKITDNLNKILSYYIEQNNPFGYIFPIIRSDIPREQDKNIQWARSRYNKKLKLLAEICGLEENITGYVSRHSFATQAMLQEVPLNAISTMLGHSSLKTTEIYLKGLPTNIMDEYNERILQQ